jgi:hypothetical protein
LLQEFQQLIEDLFHGRAPATAFRVTQMQPGKPALGSHGVTRRPP